MKLKNVLLVAALIMGSFNVVNVGAQVPITPLDPSYVSGVEKFVGSIIPGTGDIRGIFPAFSVPAPVQFTSSSYTLKVNKNFVITEANIVDDTLLYISVQFQLPQPVPIGAVLDTLVISAVGATDFVLPLRGAVVPFDVSSYGITFFDVLPGATATNSLTITSLSRQLEDFKYTFINGNPVFSVDSVGASIGTVSKLSLDVSFTAPTSPTPGTVYTDTLRISHDAYSDTIYIPVEATLAFIGVNPSHVNFGNVIFGNSVTDTITVTNYGAPIDSIVSDDNPHFTYVTAPNWTSQYGGDVYVTYAPVATIPYDNGGITFMSPSDTAAVSLRGLGGPAPILSASPMSYDFGEVIVGKSQLSSWITVTLTNSIGSHLTDPGAIVVDDPNKVFRLESIEVEYQGADGNTVYVTVSFKPNGEGEFGAALRVYADEAVPLKIDLLGVGVPPSAPSLSPQQATALSAAEASVAPVVTVEEGAIVVSQAPQGSSIQVYNLQGGVA